MKVNDLRSLLVLSQENVHLTGWFEIQIGAAEYIMQFLNVEKM